MIQRFIEFIYHNQLCLPKSRLYIAVSGGVDSMVLTHLAIRSDFDVRVLHANFQLRGLESDQDALFVERFCKENGIPFLSRNFSLGEISRSHKLNIQDTARKMRYSWFDEILNHDPDGKVATAHHHDDNIETVMLNLLRVTGIKGLSGIPVQRGNIIRPMLFAKKAEILKYSKDNHLPYREDASNLRQHYLRNRIRKQLIPVFKQLHPHFAYIMEKNIRIWTETANWMNSTVETIRKDSIHCDGAYHRINLRLILESGYPSFLLFEVLNPYGFRRDQMDKLCNAIIEHRTGAQFQSKYYELVVNRQELVLRRRDSSNQFNSILIEAPGKYDSPSGVFTLEYAAVSDVKKREPSEAYFDEDDLRFPLTLRNWQPGDLFQPFGMGGKHQKVKKFLTSQKMDRYKKENAIVLCSENRICWVVGYRTDHRFRVTDKTHSVIRCVWEKKK